MPAAQGAIERRVHFLRADLVTQGRRVQALVEEALSVLGSMDEAAASRIGAMDDAIDEVDVAIERCAVAILTEAAGESVKVEPALIREVLTIVKVNNELERIADLGCSVALRAGALRRFNEPLPPALAVMGNSVVGILRDVDTALERRDPALAKIALRSEDTVETFREATLKDSARQIGAGRMSPDFGFSIASISSELVAIADHCTNIAEQVIYAATGAIVRHMQTGWIEVDPGKRAR